MGYGEKTGSGLLAQASDIISKLKDSGVHVGFGPNTFDTRGKFNLGTNPLGAGFNYTNNGTSLTLTSNGDVGAGIVGNKLEMGVSANPFNGGSVGTYLSSAKSNNWYLNASHNLSDGHTNIEAFSNILKATISNRIELGIGATANASNLGGNWKVGFGTMATVNINLGR
jgi:hypothetical protein